MVATLVGLKWRLQRRTLAANPGQIVGLVALALLALPGLALAAIGSVAARGAEPALLGAVGAVALAVLVLGSLVGPVLVFGADETLDPGRFALLPVRARQLRPGLLLAGLTNPGGVLTIACGVLLVVMWSTSPGPAVVALVAAALGVLTCFLASRVLLATFARALASRRYRDFAAVLLMVVVFGAAIAMNVVSGNSARDPAALLATLHSSGNVLAWSPLGWAWAAPADAATGAWGVAAVRLGLAALLTVLLWWAWGRALDRALVSPVQATASTSEAGRFASIVDRMVPPGPSGAVAGRHLRHWRRDPRYLVAALSLVVLPAIMTVSMLTSGGPGGISAWLPACVVGVALGQSLAVDLAYDGSALGAHVLAGIPGRVDRLGRLISYLWVGVPVWLLSLLVGATVMGGAPDLAGIVAVSWWFFAGGAGIGLVIGPLWPGTAPPPGRPFGKGGGGAENLLIAFVCLAGCGAGLVPLVLLAWVAGWEAAAVASALLGVGALVVGVVGGGRLLDRRWPEVWGKVSAKERA